LEDFARALNVTITDNRIYFPEKVGKGYVQLVQLPAGLQALISNYYINDLFFLNRIKTNNDEFYTLRYDDIMISDKLTLKINDEELNQTSKRQTSIYLTSNLFDVSYLGTKGSSIRGINIIFNKDWMAKYLGITNSDDVLNTYLSLKTESYNIEPVDSIYRTYFDEIIHADTQDLLWLAIMQNRILLLIERFFTRLYEKSRALTHHVRISKQDINRLVNIESIIINDLTAPPPTIEALATTAAMSSAKLKRIFKDVYGTGIYSYYQKQRMQKAREMLLTGNFSVKEVGLHIGYANLSNFATAFKKEFAVLPSQAKG
jgi:AraC-like DNA-binding protein